MSVFLLGTQFQETEAACAAPHGVEEHVATIVGKSRMQVAARLASIAEAVMQPPQSAHGAVAPVAHDEMLHAAPVGIAVGDKTVAVHMGMAVAHRVQFAPGK